MQIAGHRANRAVAVRDFDVRGRLHLKPYAAAMTAAGVMTGSRGSLWTALAALVLLGREVLTSMSNRSWPSAMPTSARYLPLTTKIGTPAFGSAHSIRRLFARGFDCQ